MTDEHLAMAKQVNDIIQNSLPNERNRHDLATKISLGSLLTYAQACEALDKMAVATGHILPPGGSNAIISK